MLMNNDWTKLNVNIESANHRTFLKTVGFALV